MRNPIRTDIGYRIKLLRKKKGYDQRYLAEKIILSRASISNFERGRHTPQVELLYKIAEVLDGNIGDLLPNYKNKDEQFDIRGAINADHRLTIQQKNILITLVEEFIFSNKQNNA